MKRMSALTYNFGIKLRIYPSSQQKKMIKQNYDAQRFTYNEYVGVNRSIYQISKTSRVRQLHGNLPFASPLLNNHEAEQANLLIKLRERIATVTNLKHTYVFLQNKELDSLALANAKQNYKKAWSNYHRIGHGIPQFHKKSNEWAYQTNSMYINNPKHPKKDAYLTNGTVRFIDLHHIRVPKLGILRVADLRNLVKERISKQIPTRIGTVTIKKTATGDFTLSLQLASDVPFVKYLPKNGQAIGIDLNLDNFLTESNGSMVNNPRYYRKSKKKLAKLQRILNRRERRAKKRKCKLANAKNYQKQRKKVAKLQAHIRQQRQNFLHLLSTTLIKNHDLVVAEELRSKNLLKNHKLAQSISDVGWRTFLTMLSYKANLYGKEFHTIDPKYTTQRCSHCGTIMGHNGYDKLTLKDREWTCPICQTHHIRDWNAAINIIEKHLGIWSNRDIDEQVQNKIKQRY